MHRPVELFIANMYYSGRGRDRMVAGFITTLRLVGSFLYQENWPPRHNWNIVESGVKHHEPVPPNPNNNKTVDI